MPHAASGVSLSLIRKALSMMIEGAFFVSGLLRFGSAACHSGADSWERSAHELTWIMKAAA
jgi:hypothetical protein